MAFARSHVFPRAESGTVNSGSTRALGKMAWIIGSPSALIQNVLVAAVPRLRESAPLLWRFSGISSPFESGAAEPHSKTSRSFECSEATSRRVARFSATNADVSCSAVSPSNVRCTSSGVITPSNINASCNSSAFVAWGHASFCTFSIAAASRIPSSWLPLRSEARRVYTAWVRRSSRGALSRKA